MLFDTRQNMGTTLRSDLQTSIEFSENPISPSSFLYMDNMLSPFSKSEGFIDYFMNKIHFSKRILFPVNASIYLGTDFSSSSLIFNTVLTQKT